jgi:hypothetical protein
MLSYKLLIGAEMKENISCSYYCSTSSARYRRTVSRAFHDSINVLPEVSSSKMQTRVISSTFRNQISVLHCYVSSSDLNDTTNRPFRVMSEVYGVGSGVTFWRG